MPDKKCPRCGLWSTDSALLCDCGYNFEKGTIEESHNKKQKLNTDSGIFRALLWFFNLIFGLLLLAWPLSSIGGFFAYITEDSSEHPIMQVAIWAIWTYPVTYLIALIGSNILYKNNNLKGSILIATLPIINIIVSSPFLLPLLKELLAGSAISGN